MARIIPTFVHRDRTWMTIEVGSGFSMTANGSPVAVVLLARV